MAFYEGYYVDLSIESEIYWNQKFSDCVVFDLTEGPQDNPDIIQHKLSVTVGNRYLIHYYVEDIIAN